jgi:hypothetical protein
LTALIGRKDARVRRSRSTRKARNACANAACLRDARNACATSGVQAASERAMAYACSVARVHKLPGWEGRAPMMRRWWAIMVMVSFGGCPDPAATENHPDAAAPDGPRVADSEPGDEGGPADASGDAGEGPCVPDPACDDGSVCTCGTLLPGGGCEIQVLPDCTPCADSTGVAAVCQGGLCLDQFCAANVCPELCDFEECAEAPDCP